MLRVLMATGADFQGDIARRILGPLVIHCAVMSTVTPTARGQRNFVAQTESEREWLCSEQKHQQDG